MVLAILLLLLPSTTATTTLATANFIHDAGCFVHCEELLKFSEGDLWTI